MAASNDLRGWVMSAVSGVACVLGSSVICADLILRRFWPRSHFQIVHNNAFLSASLCLSAGVILFTSLYSMLPTSREYLMKAGWSPSRSAYALIGIFIAGVIGIRALSALLHKFLPSHVVDCAHSHEAPPNHGSDLEQGHHPPLAHRHTNKLSERTPLLARSHKSTPAVTGLLIVQRHAGIDRLGNEPWRVRLGRRLSGFMGAAKAQCDENGPCYGFSQACGNECSKTLVPPAITADDASDTDIPAPGQSPDISSSSSHTGLADDGPSSPPSEPDEQLKQPVTASQHHHHVPQNAFLSIGLQTSVAIALHKLPEGFITHYTHPSDCEPNRHVPLMRQTQALRKQLQPNRRHDTRRNGKHAAVDSKGRLVLAVASAATCLSSTPDPESRKSGSGGLADTPEETGPEHCPASGVSC